MTGLPINSAHDHPLPGGAGQDGSKTKRDRIGDTQEKRSQEDTPPGQETEERSTT